MALAINVSHSQREAYYLATETVRIFMQKNAIESYVVTDEKGQNSIPTQMTQRDLANAINILYRRLNFNFILALFFTE